MSYTTILSILHNIRQIIANYLKHKYRTSQIDGNPDTNKIVCIDESLIIHHNNNSQIWLVDAIETRSKKQRLDIINERNEINIKIIISNHIEPGTQIVTDGSPIYNFLDGEESYWTHEKHIHANGDWGYGEHSTSKIECTWPHIKNEIHSIYNIIANGMKKFNKCHKNLIIYGIESFRFISNHS